MNTRSRITGVIRLIACLSLTLVLLGYAGLIPLGRWQLDEFSELYKMRSTPLYFFERLSWSPRPISELLYGAYGWAVNHFHQPLIVPFLALLWLILLFATLYTPAQRFFEQRDRAWPIFLISLTLLVLAVSGGDATEVFYWPAGAVAYIPTLAVTLLLFLQVVDGRLATKKGRILASVCLVIAATCTEAGATFVFSYGLVQLFQRCREAWQKKTGADRRPVLWISIPLSIAAVVLVAVRMNRFRSNEVVADQLAAGHPVKSIVASFKEMAFEIYGRGILARTYHQFPNPHTWLHSGMHLPLEILAGSHLWMEVLLLVSVLLMWTGVQRPEKRTIQQILELCTALMATALFIIAAANLHFGVTCCERHELLRESWWNMILVGLAIAGASWLSDAHRQRITRLTPIAPLVLLLSVLSLGIIGPLRRTYQAYAILREATLQNSESGFHYGSDRMSLSILPSEGIITEEAIQAGVYHSGVAINRFDLDVYPYYVLRFFGKQTIVIYHLVVPGDAAAPEKN
ncbi:hypothetical protein [Silvibacterium acidisoli]|uniref:hypothetical protein n=1 Tax=Acidobacteriaceae bacterium ZG23-2 TaxID=2883246 RepID=UPI00406C0B99